jgi:hypothetical protein
MRRYVSDHGQGVSKQDIEHITIAGRRVALSEAVTDEERTLIEKAVQATTPSDQECFANALKMWQYNTRFAYTEGFAVMSDLNHGGIEHAWCMLDSEKLVDVTEAFDHYHGAIISDANVLQRYTGSELTASGIIGNHNDRYEFLRERGYVDYR